MTRHYLFLVLLLALSSPRVLWSQGPCPQQTIIASVIDRKGEHIRELDASNFTGEFHGRQVRVMSITLEEQPRHILVLLDASSSMKDDLVKWEFALNVVADLIKGVPAASSLAMVTFGDRVNEYTDFASDREAMFAILQQLAAENISSDDPVVHTALQDSIIQAITVMQPSERGDTIFIISDGQDNTSTNEWSAVERTLLGSGVRLFGFGFDDASYSQVRIQGITAIHDLAEVAENTGGRILLTPGNGFWDPPLTRLSYNVALRRVSPELPKLYAHLTSFYRLEVELPLPVGEAGTWNLELVDGGPVNKKESQLTYQRELLPCEAGKSAP